MSTRAEDFDRELMHETVEAYPEPQRQHWAWWFIGCSAFWGGLLWLLS